MLTATVLLIGGLVVIIYGMWVLFRKRQRLSGSVLLVVGLLLLIIGYSWPVALVGDSSVPEDSEVVMPIPTAAEIP